MSLIKNNQGMAKNNGENPGFDPLPLAPIEISENMSKIVLKSQIPMAIKLLGFSEHFNYIVTPI